MSDSHTSVPRWPALPPTLRDLLGKIEAETEDDLRHPRPWDLASLPDELHASVWGWLAQAVAWINECYAWQPETVIPPCWREHPHLALELAVLAFGREIAHRSSGTQEPAQWHQDLHDFHSRMAAALGAIGLQECQRGIHGERPARYELERYAS
ncbi:hypothetical protein [Sporichthya polymorpha]|uniref:hypothetical protein n=1 Tax=Sporichthya polymorpha TaxID=35751 RepID=UPI0012EC9FC9|nr:hypothetical protein [Sporichthya polymorpha]